MDVWESLLALVYKICRLWTFPGLQNIILTTMAVEISLVRPFQSSLQRWSSMS
jgi:hypothetical protein